MFSKQLTAAVCAAFIPACALAADMDSKPVLPQEAAQSMVAACFAHQQQNGYSNVNVFIVDDGGHLLAAARQTSACKACAGIAENKAVTSALYSAPRRVMADISFGEGRDGVDAALPGAAFVPGIVAFAGGLPVTTEAGVVIGGIGVSGASSDEDEQCAQAGIDAISEILK